MRANGDPFAYANLGSPELLDIMIHRIFPGEIALVSSFGIESAVLLDIVARINPATPVLFLSTGKLFSETLRHRVLCEERFGLTEIIDVRPDPGLLQQGDPHGDLWSRDADRCCELRKVQPLASVLRGFSAWITGRKRYHGGERSRLQKVEEIDGRFRINPLADWSENDVGRWIETRGLPPHPLAQDGYRSVGCAPCTRKSQPWQGVRDGRWAGKEKTECGIHNALRTRGSA